MAGHAARGGYSADAVIRADPELAHLRPTQYDPFVGGLWRNINLQDELDSATGGLAVGGRGADRTISPIPGTPPLPLPPPPPPPEAEQAQLDQGDQDPDPLPTLPADTNPPRHVREGLERLSLRELEELQAELDRNRAIQKLLQHEARGDEAFDEGRLGSESIDGLRRQVAEANRKSALVNVLATSTWEDRDNQRREAHPAHLRVLGRQADQQRHSELVNELRSTPLEILKDTLRRKTAMLSLEQQGFGKGSEARHMTTAELEAQLTELEEREDVVLRISEFDEHAHIRSHAVPEDNESMLYYYFLEIRLKPRAVIPPAITVSMILMFVAASQNNARRALFWMWATGFLTYPLFIGTLVLARRKLIGSIVGSGGLDPESQSNFGSFSSWLNNTVIVIGTLRDDGVLVFIGVITSALLYMSRNAAADATGLAWVLSTVGVFAMASIDVWLLRFDRASITRMLPQVPIIRKFSDAVEEAKDTGQFPRAGRCKRAPDLQDISVRNGLRAANMLYRRMSAKHFDVITELTHVGGVAAVLISWADLGGRESNFDDRGADLLRWTVLLYGLFTVLTATFRYTWDMKVAFTIRSKRGYVQQTASNLSELGHGGLLREKWTCGVDWLATKVDLLLQCREELSYFEDKVAHRFMNM